MNPIHPRPLRQLHPLINDHIHSQTREQPEPPGKGQRTTADHAVVVTGVDTANNIVHLNDSGIVTGRDEQIPMDTFTQAWATGNNLLIVTQQTNNI